MVDQTRASFLIGCPPPPLPNRTFRDSLEYVQQLHAYEVQIVGARQQNDGRQIHVDRLQQLAQPHVMASNLQAHSGARLQRRHRIAGRTAAAAISRTEAGQSLVDLLEARGQTDADQHDENVHVVPGEGEYEIGVLFSGMRDSMGDIIEAI